MAKRRVIPGDFGDCEITAMGFETPNVIVKILDRNNGEFYTIVFSVVEFMLFETNHVQNVMSFVDLFENVREALKNTAFVEWLADRGLSTEIEKLAGNHRICFLTPIVGAHALMICEGVSLS